MASTTTLYRTANWENAQSAHGPSLAAWLDEYLEGEGRTPSAVSASLNRRLYAWRNGEDPGFFTVDRWLTRLGLHPMDAPYGVWQPWKSRGRRSEDAA